MTIAAGLCALHGLLGHVHRESAAPAAGLIQQPALVGEPGGEVVLGAILACALIVLAAGFRAAGRRRAQPTAAPEATATWR
jgi:hypothetical protein